ncbi:MAG: hypothetical protein JXQ67_09410 [Campylobacterales bacterium]|nr:hypothetical protein [Campylobacterales bacterium]
MKYLIVDVGLVENYFVLVISHLTKVNKMILNKLLWAIWWFATIVVLIGGTALYISFHNKDIQITLIKGETINFEVFRVLPDSISMKLEFTRDKRSWPELGNWERKVNLADEKISTEQNNKYIKDIGDSEFKETVQLPLKFPTPNDWINPGEPIEILFTHKKQSVIYYAWPCTFSYPARSLVPLLINTNLKLGVGFNKIQVRIEKVGKLLSGERITLRIASPMGLKSSQPNHFYFLKYFIFTPIYVAILLIILITLLIIKWRLRKMERP